MQIEKVMQINMISFTDEHKENLSKSHKGKLHTEETKNKMSNSHKNPQTKLECPFCKKIGGNSMKRWHFNNCNHASK